MEDPYVDLEDIDSPFFVKQRHNSSAGGTRKKHKSDKSVGAEAMVLTEGDLDEIGDTIKFVIKDIQGHIEEQYQSILTKVQVGLKELQVHASQVQVSVVQASQSQVSKKPTTQGSVQSVLTSELRVVPS